jgi:predicted N-acetyltransferase YhbS
LAVDPDVRGKGIGVSLVRESLHLAVAEGWEWCFISGEPDYYLKFGFKPVTYDDITLPAHIEPERLHLLALPQAKPELMPEKPWVIMPSDPAASDASDNKDDVRQAKDVS